MKGKEYTKNFKIICRVIAKYAVLKLINHENDSVEVEQYVDLIVKAFPFNSNAVDLKDLYKVKVMFLFFVNIFSVLILYIL